jgi:fused signal recognition particle receptor
MATTIQALFPKGGAADRDVLEDLEEALYGADLGAGTTEEILEEVGRSVRRGSCSADDVARIAARTVASVFDGRSRSLAVPGDVPAVFLFVGVNGTGKTTTIGKLAHRLARDGRRPLMASCDTYRAAAVDQLRIWSERAGAAFVGGQQGGDPAAVAFDALDAAARRGCDVVLVDSAGRIHTRANLMEELRKLRRVIARKLPGAPQEILLVVDATTGGNALVQARQFHDAVGLTGVVLTKLDGTARGGIVVAIERELDVPVKLVGLGEELEDLQPFEPEAFAAALAGIGSSGVGDPSSPEGA